MLLLPPAPAGGLLLLLLLPVLGAPGVAGRPGIGLYPPKGFTAAAPRGDPKLPALLLLLFSAATRGLTTALQPLPAACCCWLGACMRGDAHVAGVFIPLVGPLMGWPWWRTTSILPILMPLQHVRSAASIDSPAGMLQVMLMTVTCQRAACECRTLAGALLTPVTFSTEALGVTATHWSN
jgi:hypothetical protein